MSNTIQIRDNQGQAVYPITDESLVIGLNERFQQMTNRSYTITWDGTAAPTVANIPAGVVVTYNGTNYTGTLAASENTFNYIYLVKNGNNYDQYVTSSGAGTYTWVFMGTTEIDLSDYATKNEINQLGQEVDELQSAVSVSEPTGEDEDVLFETNAGNFAGKIDGEGGHFKNIFIQEDEAGTNRTDVAQELSTLSQGLTDAEEELTKLDSVEVSSTQNENQEIVVTDSDDNEVAKVNEDGITAKDVFVGGTPLSAFSFVGMTAIFDNLGFIGDSLSSGYLAAPDVGGESPAVPVGDGSKGRNIYRMSWGQILARMYGAKATNFSVGGLTAKGWLDTYPGKTSENGYNSDGTFAVTFNSQPKGFYTICLGTNDSADEITNPVGDVTTDIDTEDYHNNADTFAGNYAKIIQICRELTPSCKIFVITPFSWWSYGAESKGYNDVVRAMPGIFDKVYLIDLYTDYYGHTPQYVYGGHGTTMGYVFTATAIAKAIDSIVRANEDDFKFQSIVTRARQDEGQY